MEFKNIIGTLKADVWSFLRPLLEVKNNPRGLIKVYHDAGWDIQTILDSQFTGIFSIIEDLDNAVTELNALNSDGKPVNKRYPINGKCLNI